MTKLTYDPPEQYDEKVVLFKEEDGSRMRMWCIIRQGNKHRTYSGLMGGAITETSWTESKGKNFGKINATTDAEQASIAMKLKARLKRENGFSEDGKSPTIIEGRVFTSPTLAQKWENMKHKIVYPCFTSPKLDGIRCIVTKDGMFSRHGKEFVAVPHIREELQPLFDEDPDLILDGELYNHQLRDDFDKICSIVKRKRVTPADLAEAKRVMQYWVFDMKYDAPFKERYARYGELLLDKDNGQTIYRFNYTVPVRQFTVGDESAVARSCQDFIESNFEGGMIRNADAPYIEKRTWNLLKYKEFEDDEFEIIDITEGAGNRAGMMGRIHLITGKKHKHPGEKFESSAKGSHAYFRKLLEEKDDYIGKLATVKYQNLTPRGVPRFPVVTAIRDYE